ncbi:MAG: YfiR family protein [Flammeovirgaceae bacterium]|nr:YfiR family protein [Flammeovirgaceae bacterium]
MYLRFKPNISFTILLFFTLTLAHAQYSEYEIKGTMIFNFAKFITWPEKVFDKDNKIVLGILGDDPFGEIIDNIVKGRMVKGKSWEVRRGKTVDELRSCHIIFIGKGNEESIATILEEIYSKRQRASVLTIGDNIPNFCELGGMINFKQGSYMFSINANAMTNASLLIDVNLLKFADEIINYEKDKK